ncbi:MAG: hypothetical protein AB7M05_02490 [Alphaproteobacteria bacterium]
MTERSFLHPIYSAPLDANVIQAGDSPRSAHAAEIKPDTFSMDDIGLARGAVPAEIWDWKRRHS